MEKVIEIWKKVIYISAKYSNYNKEEKEVLLNEFQKFKNELLWKKSEYSETVLWFIQDLEGDIRSNRPLEIDTIEHDNYLENYIVTKKELNHYNNLINEEIYINIFKKINNNFDIKNIHNDIIELEKIFLSEIEKISAKNIAKNLLIFTLYERKITSQALKRLYNFLLQIPEAKESLIRIRSMISKYYTLIQEVLMESVNYYNKKEYNVTYMRFIKESNKNWIKKHLKKYNSSQQNYRTWNPEYEYKYLLKKLRWN